MAITNDNMLTLLNIMHLMEADQIETALSDAFEALLKEVSASSGGIWLKSPDTMHIYSIVSVGENNIAGFSIEYGQGIVGEISDGNKELFIADTGGDCILLHTLFYDIMCVIFKLTSFFNIQNKECRTIFSKHDTLLLLQYSHIYYIFYII